jgi:hypothetical protein
MDIWLTKIIIDAHRRVDAIRASKGLPPIKWEDRGGITLEELQAKIQAERPTLHKNPCQCGCGFILVGKYYREWKQGHRPKNTKRRKRSKRLASA